MSDSMQTTVLTVGPDGKVNADFSGTVHAEGLLLPEATNVEDPNDVNLVEWLSADGVPREQIFGSDQGADYCVLIAAANHNRDRPNSIAYLEALGEGVSRAALECLAEGNDWQITAGTLMLIDSIGRSSYPQVASLGKHVQGGGQLAVEWAAKGVASAAIKVEHGLGAVPRFVTGTALGFNGCYAEVANLTETSFEIRLVSTSGEVAAGTKHTVNWHAET